MLEMNRSIEQSLLALLPSLNTALPPPLVELASSFLAQSRHRASTLKAEEEIARPYACAHIACNRLKTSLNLPPISEHGAPIAPRLYKRLYNHLDRILEASSINGRSTPGRSRADGLSGDLGSASRSLPLGRLQPRRSLSQFRNSSTGQAHTPSSKTPKQADPSSVRADNSLPRWVQPTLAFICKTLDNAIIGPIVLAGIRSVVVPQGRRTNSAWLNENLSGVVCTIYLYVWTSAETLRDPDGKKLDRARYAGMRRQVLEAMAKARGAVIVRGVSEDMAWAEWTETSSDILDKTMTLLNRQGSLEADWTNGIADMVRQEAGLPLELEDEDGGSGADQAQSLRFAKVDTMLQDRYDYLSEHRRQEYARWKEGIMSRIRKLQAAEQSAEMQVDG